MQRGIGFLAGTDAACEGGLPGYSLHDELRLFVQAGLTPTEALKTATINPAKYLELTDSLGTIAKGKRADGSNTQWQPFTGYQQY
jgi:imidazolonepropionase-like amidohydrolase